jgi:ATP-dependent RNA helicase DDX35
LNTEIKFIFNLKKNFTKKIKGLLKKVMRRRPDLRLVVCSATVDAEEFKLYFDEGEKKKAAAVVGVEAGVLTTAIVSVEGRYFPIEVAYLSEPCDDYVKASVGTAFALHVAEEDRDGDILIFLTGQVLILRYLRKDTNRVSFFEQGSW